MYMKWQEYVLVARHVLGNGRVVQSANFLIANHMGTDWCPGYSTSHPAPCLWLMKSGQDTAGESLETP